MTDKQEERKSSILFPEPADTAGRLFCNREWSAGCRASPNLPALLNQI